MSKEKWKGLAALTGAIAGIQLARIVIKALVFLVLPRTLFYDRVASFIAMALLTGGGVALARRRGLALSVFPRPGHYLPYILAGAGVFALAAVGFAFGGGTVLFRLFQLAYAGVMTPVFEELIFRGWVWSRVHTLFPGPWATVAVTAGLFSLWHLGYADAYIFRVGTQGLAGAMAWKAAIGLGYGLVLGPLRFKTENCLSTMLLHGAMNIVAR